MSVTNKKIFLSLLGVLTLVLAASPLFAKADSSGFFNFINTSFFSQKTTPTTLSETDIANITKPGVVRIVQKDTGTIKTTINFKVDFANFKTIPLPTPKTVSFPLSNPAIGLGSGFFITPDGDILTNSHVVSNKEVLAEFVASLSKSAIDAAIEQMSPAEQQALNTSAATPEGQQKAYALGKEIATNLLDNSVLVGTTTITVLNPSSTGKTLDDLIAEGIPATIVWQNDNFNTDGKDVAIIHINKTGLPALALAASSTLSIGGSIHAIGFPANADLQSSTNDIGDVGSGFLTPTFTSGVVSAFKDSINSDFKLIETDAKVSSGSSGSPIVDANGNVVGIITYDTDKDTQTNGDSFSEAIPLQVINEAIAKANITPSPGSLATDFIQGLGLLANNHCASAIQSFTLANQTDQEFMTSDFISPYIARCKTIQQQGKSIDSPWQQLLYNLQSNMMIVWIGGGALIFLLIIIVMIWLFLKLRKDEHTLAGYQAPAPNFHPPEPTTPTPFISSVAPMNPATPVAPINVPPQDNSSADEIVTYIKNQLASGTNEGAIVVQLRTQGHNDQEIQKGFEIVKHIDPVS